MIVLDLKWVLLGLLLVATAVIYLSVVVMRRRRFPLQTQLADAPVGLALLNRKTAVTYANAAAQRLLTPEVTAELRGDVRRLLGNDAVATHYRTLNLPDDQAVSWWIVALDRGCLALLTDLSRQRQTERASHLFLNSLSHELRTPLTAVLAHLEVLRTPDLPDAVRDNSLQLIHQETRRMARLVGDLLALGRLEATAELEHRPVDLLLIAEEAIADIILEAESRHIAITLQADAVLPRVLADPDKIKQLFLNVLDNGVKYGRAHDTITVSLSQQAAGVQVVVRDTGPGIPAEHLPHVRQKLYRARTDVEGSGLGLALADEILARHQSHLIIESETEGDETGTAVRFVLPIV